MAHPCEARVGLGVASRLRSVLHQEVFFCKRAPRSALQVALEFLREMFFRQRNVRRQVPRFEFIGVNRFSAIVFGEAVAQIVRGTNVSLVGMCFASQEVDVVHGARLRLPDWNLGILSWFGCRRVRVAVTFGATAGTRLRQKSAMADKLAVADFWRRRVEAGGVEPPSEKRYGPKPTCLAQFRLFRQPRSE